MIDYIITENFNVKIKYFTIKNNDVIWTGRFELWFNDFNEFKTCKLYFRDNEEDEFTYEFSTFSEAESFMKKFEESGFKNFSY